MAKTKGTSFKDVSIERELRPKGEILKKLFGLANENIERMSRSDFIAFLLRYTELIEGFSEKMPQLDISKRREKLIIAVSTCSDDDLGKNKNVFIELQLYLRSVLGRIISAFDCKENYTIIGLTVKQETYVDSKNDSFSTRYDPTPLSDHLDLESEKKIIQIVLTSMLQEFNLKPSRLHQCEREVCSNFFFQYTEGSKYCSSKCSNAQTQAALRQRRSIVDTKE